MDLKEIKKIKAEMVCIYGPGSAVFVRRITDACFIDVDTEEVPVSLAAYLDVKKAKDGYGKAMEVVKYVKLYPVNVMFSDVPSDAFAMLFDMIETDPSIHLTDDGKEFFCCYHKKFSR